MKHFPLLVQEMEVKIPAPVCEVVAHAATATAAAAAPPPSRAVALHGKFGYGSRCFASTVPLSDPSYSLTWSPTSTLWHYQCQPPHWQNLLPCSVLALREIRTKWCSQKKHDLASMKSLLDLSVSVTQQSIDEGAACHCVNLP